MKNIAEKHLYNMITFKLTVLLVIMISSSQTFSQVDSSVKRINDAIRKSLKERKPWYEQIRDGFYNKDGFERYKGTIKVVEDNTILYDSIILKTYTALPEYKIIFEKGIFYPGVLIGDQSGGITQPIRIPDSIEALGNCRTNYNTIGVHIFKEVQMDKKSTTTKRFRIWRWVCASANPSEYIFDLENETADEETSIKNFIEGSKLTFIRFVTIII